MGKAKFFSGSWDISSLVAAFSGNLKKNLTIAYNYMHSMYVGM